MTVNDNWKKLTARQRRVIPFLLTCPTVVQAAELAEVGEATVHRWLRTDALFRSELMRAESGLLDSAARRLVQLADAALDVLQDILDSPECSVAQRRQAAESVLSHVVRLRELVQLESRINDLERAVNSRSH